MPLHLAFYLGTWDSNSVPWASNVPTEPSVQSLYPLFKSDEDEMALT